MRLPTHLLTSISKFGLEAECPLVCFIMTDFVVSDNNPRYTKFAVPPVSRLKEEQAKDAGSILKMKSRSSSMWVVPVFPEDMIVILHPSEQRLS